MFSENQVSLTRKLIWSPSILGIFFVVIAIVDVLLLDQQRITLQQVLTNEMVVFIVSLISAIVVLLYGIISAFKKKWQKCAIAAFNMGVFLVCFFIAAYNGVAVLYAT